MGIVYAGLSPHAPILLPSIGLSHIKRVEGTILGLKNLCQELEEVNPQALILITPHGPLHSDRLTLFDSSKAKGDFSPFGYPQLSLSLDLCQELNQELFKALGERYLYPIKEDDPAFTLDHGALVPLYFLKEEDLLKPVTLLSMGLLEYQDLFTFGQLLTSVCQDFPQDIALLVSGDLSHRLTPDAPAGYSPLGEQFDREVALALLDEDAKALLKIDRGMIMKAGECGLRPLLVMMGVISQLPFTGEIFSYEGPFGVGYMVAGFKERRGHG